MAREGMLNSDTTIKRHYSRFKCGSLHSLARLEKSGFITSTNVAHDNKRTRAYSVAYKEMVNTLGGQLQEIGARRMKFH